MSYVMDPTVIRDKSCSLPSDSRRNSTHCVHVHGQRFRIPALEADRTTYPPADVIEPAYRLCASVGAIMDTAAALGVDLSQIVHAPCAGYGWRGIGAELAGCLLG